ncbi:MAG: NERD domain-containing protein [Bacilli bacterium]|nr:NERD domain-containing protein [Bacilli bacterium]
MGLINTAIDAFRFKDTIIYKENSDLQDKYDALKKLNKEYPNNEDLLSELYIVKKGLDGENEIAYQLKKANIGMYVLRDIKLRYQDLTAQIDYVIISPIYTYYVECKNLVGNITVTDKGDFIRELNINGKRIKKGMYSPLRQVEAQREVVRKLWDSNSSNFIKFFGSKYFDYYRRVLVVAANHETILNTSKAPKELRHKILRADALVRQIEYDLNNCKIDDPYKTRKDMEQSAQAYIDWSYSEQIDFYGYYKEKYINSKIRSNDNSKENCVYDKEIIDDNLKEKLIKFRKARSNEMGIPAYYVFTNDELERLIDIRPKTFDELQKAKILSQIKLVTHGKQIIEVINNN